MRRKACGGSRMTALGVHTWALLAALTLVTAMPYSHAGPPRRSRGHGGETVSTARARGDTAPSAASEPHPHWARDLGLRWMGADANATPAGRGQVEMLMSRLARTPPREWLPPDLAYKLELCEAARRGGMPTRPTYDSMCGLLELCPTRPPAGQRAEPCTPRHGNGILQNLIYGITFIPAERVRAARLPRSGARMVVDCGAPGIIGAGNGRHLQIRADLPWERQLTLIRNTLSQTANAVLGSTLDETPTAQAGADAGACDANAQPWAPTAVIDARGPMTTAALTYSLGEASSITERSFRRRRRVTSWDFLQADDGRYYVAKHADTNLPREYVSQRCFVDNRGSGVAPGPVRTAARLAALRARVRELRDSTRESGIWPESTYNEYIDALSEIDEAIHALYPSSAALREAKIAAEARYNAQCSACYDTSTMRFDSTRPGCTQCDGLFNDMAELGNAHSVAIQPELERIAAENLNAGCRGLFNPVSRSEECAALTREMNQLQYGTDESPYSMMGTGMGMGMMGTGMGMGFPGGMGDGEGEGSQGRNGYATDSEVEGITLEEESTAEKVFAPYYGSGPDRDRGL